MENTEYEQEYHAAVDIPTASVKGNGVNDEWYALEYFYTKEEAIKWAQENLGADEEGRICVVSTF